MGHTDLRGTAPLERLVINSEKKVGVVSLSSGAGATFICNLLRREGASSDSATDIVDLGEERDSASIGTMLVVADCRAEVNKNFPQMIKHLTKRGVDFGLVLNRYNAENKNEALAEFCSSLDSKIPVFKVPVVETEHFTDLYNYVFYN